MSAITRAEEALHTLEALWHLEQQHALEAQRQLPLKERVRRGFALQNLELLDWESAHGGRLKLWLAPRRDLLRPEDLDMRPGTPARLWLHDPDHEVTSARGTIWQITPARIGLYLDAPELPDWLHTPGFQLDRDELDVTFTRGLRAIQTTRNAPPRSQLAIWRTLFYGDRAPKPLSDAHAETLICFDEALHADQRRAVARALSAQEVALIHGPPGTGKTRTLIELIRQAVRRGERVLACAASNLATDHLVERLAAAQVEVVRLGHPARLTPEALPHALDVRLEAKPIYKLARAWLDDADAQRRRATTRCERGVITRRDLHHELHGARQLTRDAQVQLQLARREILGAAQVICTTATGADNRLLEGIELTWIVLDEATQASDPLALIPFGRGERIVLAGDPQQLPPTIRSDEAARKGLGTTLFERIAARHPQLVTLLTEQHRMNEAIMTFPSLQSYDALLTAHPSVAHHTLEDLGVAPDPLRPGPLVFIDSAGRGWDEAPREDDDEDHSTSNPQQAARCAAEARRLLSRGLLPEHLAIITPYDAQLRLLRQLLSPELERGLAIATVDSFQGREREAVLIDLVRSNPDGEIGFLADTRRMNVAITRARRALFILGDSATLGAHPYYSALLDHVQADGAWISAWDDDAPELQPLLEVFDASPQTE